MGVTPSTTTTNTMQGFVEEVQKKAMEEIFDSATQYVSVSSTNFSQDTLLRFYGLYKQATVGPCGVHGGGMPSFFDMKGRSKYQAWLAVGNISQHEAMQAYIEELYRQVPGLADELAKNQNDATPGGGYVFSTLAGVQDAEPQSDHEGELWWYAKMGKAKELVDLLASGAKVNDTDEDGRSALHWAADQGQIDVVRELLSHDAPFNSQDNDGQTPLHYAVTCDREEVCKVLISAGANIHIQDNDGETAHKNHNPNWAWWPSS
eukprot:c8254_g1_i1.p1 GENE.c8254_g1_i1~~c8254_g1_i1.p1  ORF type:complete len:262 (+),score=62.36 c8254_g1_i1:1-786(+)